MLTPHQNEQSEQNEQKGQGGDRNEQNEHLVRDGYRIGGFVEILFFRHILG